MRIALDLAKEQSESKSDAPPIRIILAHEMPGDDNEWRFGVDFSTFFSGGYDGGAYAYVLCAHACAYAYVHMGFSTFLLARLRRASPGVASTTPCAYAYVRHMHMRACPHAGATPWDLVRRGIYHTIAAPLKGGPWRHKCYEMLAASIVCICIRMCT